MTNFNSNSNNQKENEELFGFFCDYLDEFHMYLVEYLLKFKPQFESQCYCSDI